MPCLAPQKNVFVIQRPCLGSLTQSLKTHVQLKVDRPVTLPGVNSWAWKGRWLHCVPAHLCQSAHCVPGSCSVGAIPGGLSIGPPGKSSIDDSYGRYELIQNSESPASPPVAVPHSWSRAKSDSDKISNGSSISWPPGKTALKW